MCIFSFKGNQCTYSDPCNTSQLINSTGTGLQHTLMTCSQGSIQTDGYPYLNYPNSVYHRWAFLNIGFRSMSITLEDFEVSVVIGSDYGVQSVKLFHGQKWIPYMTYTIAHIVDGFGHSANIFGCNMNEYRHMTCRIHFAHGIVLQMALHIRLFTVWSALLLPFSLLYLPQLPDIIDEWNHQPLPNCSQKNITQKITENHESPF